MKRSQNLVMTTQRYYKNKSHKVQNLMDFHSTENMTQKLKSSSSSQSEFQRRANGPEAKANVNCCK